MNVDSYGERMNWQLQACDVVVRLKNSK